MRGHLGALTLTLCLTANVVWAQPPRDAQSGDVRAVESTVELAWMNDPITFPYNLRATFRGGVLEVAGAVPSTIVRRQALNIARVVGSKSVLDQTDLFPGCEKAEVTLASGDVIVAAQSHLSRGMPQLASSVRIECDDNGRVTLTGSASTMAEKVAASALMRRVPGCVAADNRMTVGETAIVPVANNRVVMSAPNQMRSRIEKLCPQVHSVSVRQIDNNRFHISFSAANASDAHHAATAIFVQDDWKALRLDLDVHVPQ